MTNEIKIQWEDNMLFSAETIGGNLKIDAAVESGGQGKGVRPKALMLTALAGCTGMDVVSLFKKMRIEVDNIVISVKANLTEEHPKYYDKVVVIYDLTAADFQKEKIEKAIKLSQDRYCGVSEMFRQFSDLSYQINYIQKK